MAYIRKKFTDACWAGCDVFLSELAPSHCNTKHWNKGAFYQKFLLVPEPE